jgi:hypothetical protein
VETEVVALSHLYGGIITTGSACLEEIETQVVSVTNFVFLLAEINALAERFGMTQDEVIYWLALQERSTYLSRMQIQFPPLSSEKSSSPCQETRPKRRSSTSSMSYFPGMKEYAFATAMEKRLGSLTPDELEFLWQEYGGRLPMDV